MAATTDEHTVVKMGHLAGNTAPSTYLYVPFDVPAGVSRLSFHGDHTNKLATALDIALFDDHGHGFDDDAGFRGSSGGDWSDFHISASDASDSYLPGPIEQGTWYLMLSPYRVSAQGTDWTITITMDFGPPGPAFVPTPYPRTVNDTPGWYHCDDHVHITATGGSDAHNPVPLANHPIGHAQTVVHAEGLSVDTITRAVKAGHAFVAANSDVSMRLTASTDDRTVGMGDRLDVGPAAHVTVSLRVQGAPGTVATLHNQDGAATTVPIHSDDTTIRWTTTPAQSRYVRAEVRHSGGTMVEFSNPIWLGHQPTLRPVATVGTPDGSAMEFALWPNHYGAYSATFPHDVDVTAGRDDPSKTWSYLQPGPADSFAGNREHPFTLRFTLDRVPSHGLRFQAWLVDTPVNRAPYYPASMRVSVNGADAGSQDRQPGVHSGDGYHWGDGTLSFGGVYSQALWFTLPRAALHPGDNAVTVTLTRGSWVVWDAAGVFTTSPSQH